MKKFNIILIVALLLPVVLSAKKVYEAEKVVNHNFPASGNHTLVIDNKYGNINVEIWDKDEVSATITITGHSSQNQEMAEEMVNRVKIHANASGRNITFRTELTSVKSNSGNNGNDIRYEVKVPRNIAFNLTNKYGDINIDECGNTAVFDVKYGNFGCAKMKGDSKLVLGYGNATVQEASNFTAEIKYSNLNLGTAQMLELDSKYSNIKVDKVGNLDGVASGYDNFKIGEVDVANIDTKYTPIRIGKVNRRLGITNKYGSVKIDDIGEKISTIGLDLGYTDVKLNIPSSVSYDFNITSRYGDVSLTGVTTNIKRRERNNNTLQIEGTVGNNKPTLVLKATNSYANISITSK
ncbi:MAG: DUF4097 family beta strand repeat-containing protein [Prevotellaceae bacterium]|jgi:hypothetical protein|nr:DUF4097 family beta strand repeat-containing protein [Prevotellaceae bacterium]